MNSMEQRKPQRPQKRRQTATETADGRPFCECDSGRYGTFSIIGGTHSFTPGARIPFHFPERGTGILERPHGVSFHRGSCSPFRMLGLP